MINPKALRAAAKAKAHRLANGDSKKVDASTWEPCAPMNTDAKTGMQPISRQARKRGGKIEGVAAAARSDRKSRGAQMDRQEVNDFVNRDVKKANAEKFGAPHNGGFKRGGRAEGGSTGRKSMFEDMRSKYIQNKPIGESSGLFSPSRRDRAAAPVGYNGSEDESSPGSPMSAPSRSASPGEGAMTGNGRAQPAPRPRPAVAVKSGPTPGELEADRLMAKYNAPAERNASPGEGALTGTGQARAEPEGRERMKAYNTASDMGLKSGGTARKARASGGSALELRRGADEELRRGSKEPLYRTSKKPPASESRSAQPGDSGESQQSYSSPRGPGELPDHEPLTPRQYEPSELNPGVKFRSSGGTARKARASGGQLLNDLAASTQRSGVPTGRMGFTKKSSTPLPGSMKRGGRTGEKAATTNIVISMAPSKGAAAAPMGGGAMPVPVPSPMPPMGGGLPPGAMLPRKSGGRVPHRTAGAGSGAGRLEKIT